MVPEMKKSKTVTKSSVSLSVVESANKALVSDFAKADNDGLDSLRKKYLGKNGVVSRIMSGIREVSPDQRAEYGKAANEFKRQVEEEVEKLGRSSARGVVGATMGDDSFDVSAPFAPNTPIDKRPQLISRPGTTHPVTDIGQKALKIWETMGFHITEARHLDDDYNVFEALNIPAGHPARDMWDTFWTEDGLVPITHTSSMQNRIIKSCEIPIREVIIGKCYRNEATDASHEHTFYQSEGIYVDKKATLADLIGTLSSFMNEYFGQNVKYMIQPSYFPFVEPGLEFLVECLICGQKGCPFCSYSGWIELVPCGMIHPNVLSMGGLDPKEYRGFAWAFGFDRLVMLRSRIQDIRNIHGGDLRFLEQFR